MAAHPHRVAHGVGSVIKWTIAILALFILVVMVIAIIGIGSAVNKSEESSKQVSPASYSQVHNGMTTSELQQLLGRPERTDMSEVSGLGNLSCWYYGILAASGSYQFCFENGQLAYKSQYR
jgi:hypothetical protein